MSDQITGDPLAGLSLEEINAMQADMNAFFDAYRTHLTSPAKPGTQKAPFNFHNFLANFINIYNVVAPIIGTFVPSVKLPPIPTLPPTGTTPPSTV